MKVGIDGPPRRQRLGCDYCQQNVETEYFAGTLGHELWFCLSCVDSIQDWKPPHPQRGDGMSKLLCKILNLLLHLKWTDCTHDWIPEPDTFADWICKDCGVGR